MKKALLVSVLALLAVPAQAQLQTYPISPCRLEDSRIDGWLLGNGMWGWVSVAGRCDIPADAQVVMITLIAVKPTHNGHFVVFSETDEMPPTSSMNFNAGLTASSMVFTKISQDQAFFVFAQLEHGGHVDWVVDVTAYLK